MSNIIMIESISESDSNLNEMYSYFLVLYSLTNMKTQSHIPHTTPA